MFDIANKRICLDEVKVIVWSWYLDIYFYLTRRVLVFNVIYNTLM